MFDSVWLWITLLESVLVALTVFGSGFLCLALCIYCIWLSFDFCRILIVQFYSTLFEFAWIYSTVFDFVKLTQLCTNFVLVFKQNAGQTNFAQTKIWSKKLRATKKIGYKKFGKIGSVIAESFLVWTKVAKANVACTNVTVTVFICWRWSQEPTYKVWSKLGQ